MLDIPWKCSLSSGTGTRNHVTRNINDDDGRGVVNVRHWREIDICYCVMCYRSILMNCWWLDQYV